MTATRFDSAPSSPMRFTGASVSPRGASAYILLIAALALVATLPLVDWLPATSWHDQQRVGQIVIFVLIATAAALLIWAPSDVKRLLTRWPRRLISLVLAAALLSALLAHRPGWAFTEVAMGASCLGLAWTVAVARRRFGAGADYLLLAALALTVGGLMARFLVAYLAAATSGLGVLNAWALVDGFSNPRFYGQFMTLSLPMLAVPLLAEGKVKRYAWVAALLLVLAWMAAITSGTRGTWMAMACAVVALACASRGGRRWALLQLVAAVAGTALFWFLINMLPGWLGLVVTHDATGRMTTSLSLRGVIWKDAIAMAMRHPLLGVGPMQFADTFNGVAAHPHQAWLQWAAELGFPSAFVVTGLVLWAGWRLVPVLRSRAESTQLPDVLRLCLAGAVIGGLAHSMVSGVLVMPYAQLWLSILAGWLLGLQPRAVPADREASAGDQVSTFSRGAWLALFTASVALLVFVAARDYPRLAQREQAFAQNFGGQLEPRFWTQGVIAQKK